MTDEILVQQLIRDEGVRLMPYRDTAKPVGKLTIGVGHNLDDLGISRAVADLMLTEDIQRAHRDCLIAFRWFESLSPPRQRVLLNMCFNLGITRLNGFRKMLAALADRNYEQAAVEMLDSKWATQVGSRALRLAEQMRSGLDQ